MSIAKDSKVTLTQVLVPVMLTACTLLLMLAFQFSQNWRNHDDLRQAKAQQEKPLADAQKIQSQLVALALGTKKLADQGDKDAQTIIAQMKQAGISVGGPEAPAGGAPGSAAPVAPPQPAAEQP